MSRDKELKLCPFCGHNAFLDVLTEPHTHELIEYDENFHYVQFVACHNCSCGLHGEATDDKEKAIQTAIDAWNSRYTGHKWVKKDDYFYCQECGVVLREDGKNSPCKGKVKISLRGNENERV